MYLNEFYKVFVVEKNLSDNMSVVIMTIKKPSLPDYKPCFFFFLNGVVRCKKQTPIRGYKFLVPVCRNNVISSI